MIGRILASAFCIFATMAKSEPVIVSIGELPDATRLVLTFANRPEWSSTSSKNEYAISIGAPGYEIGVSQVARQIAGTRISDVDITENGLVIGMNCDCQAAAFEFGVGGIIVEIRDAVGPTQDTSTSSPRIRQAPIAESLLPTLLPSPFTDSRVVKASPQKFPAYVGPYGHTPWAAPASENGLIEELGLAVPGSDAAVAMLSRELSRAASQGMIEANMNQQRRVQATEFESLPELENRSNLAIITGLDRGFVVPRNSVSSTHNGSVCLSNSDVDLSAWGDTSGLRELGALRGKAVAEDGSVRPQGAKEIARYYIALGFGSEARTAAVAMEEGPAKDLLLTLAQIMDQGRSQFDTLDGQILCEGKIALWAALAGPIDPEEIPVSTDAILSTFSALPRHLRAHLGPVLAERLRAVGLEDDARRAVNAVARGGLQSNESELVAARLRLAGTRHEAARDTLTGLSNGTDVTAAEALLELLKDAERRGMAPNPDWVEDAPSLTRATEGTTVAADLNLAGLRGRIALGQFDELRAALSSDSPGLDSNSRNELSANALVAAAHTADDVTFLKSELGLSKLMNVETMTRTGRFAVATRLSDLGLPKRAQAYLPTDPETPSERTVAAKILHETGNTMQAISLLSGNEELDVAESLGSLYAADGQENLAIQTYVGGGHLDRATQAAIRAGDWNWIATNDVAGSSGGLASATRSLMTPMENQGVMSQIGNGDLVRASQARRSEINTLLSETEFTDVPEMFTN